MHARARERCARVCRLFLAEILLIIALDRLGPGRATWASIYEIGAGARSWCERDGSGMLARSGPRTMLCWHSGLGRDQLFGGSVSPIEGSDLAGVIAILTRLMRGLACGVAGRWGIFHIRRKVSPEP